MSRNLLLISSSVSHPTGYLEHPEPAIREIVAMVNAIQVPEPV